MCLVGVLRLCGRALLLCASLLSFARRVVGLLGTLWVIVLF